MIFTRGSFHRAAALLAAAGIASASSLSAHAQQQENTHTTSFDAWVLSCFSPVEKDGDKAGEAKACEVRTTVVVKDEKSDQKGVAAVIAIGRAGPGQPLQVMAQVPLAALLNQPIKLLGEGDKVIADLSYLACQPQACTAGARITPAQLDQLKQANDAIYVGYINQAGQKLKVEASTKGLAKALQALDKE